MRTLRSYIWLQLLALMFIATARAEPQIAVKEYPSVDREASFIAYYVGQAGPEAPSLLVRLKGNGRNGLVAEVFDVPEGSDSVPVTITGDGALVLRGSEKARLVISTRSNSWVVDGRPNMNLDVRIYGPLDATWHARYDEESGYSGWPLYVGPTEESVQITVRDDAVGSVPAWELRELVPAFPRRGFYRVEYSQRMCAAPAAFDPGISPEWPYVRSPESPDGYLQPGLPVLLPPIVVDWNEGRLIRFGELVPVRAQPCSYALYSIAPLGDKDAVSDLDFESPFAFYDLAGDSGRRPNLILRTAHFPAGDPWSSGLGSDELRGAILDRDYTAVRYSWRNAVGDGRWDYKIEVVGHHEFNYETPIADGAYTISAPAYEQYPRWVTDHSWPGVAFVDSESRSFTSSEGIYDLRPGEVGLDYVLGWSDEYDSIDPKALSVGLRGEYRVTTDQVVRLYLSPVDNRLHLLGAEHGYMRLDEDRLLTVQDQVGDGYIDTWILDESRSVDATANAVAANGEDVEVGTLSADTGNRALRKQSVIHQFDRLLLFATDGLLILQEHELPKSLFEFAPPHDHSSWENFVSDVGQFDALRSDYGDLVGWLDRFPGTRIRLEGVTVTQLQPTADRLTFVIDVDEDVTVESDGPPTIFSELVPGTYSVSYSVVDGVWEVLAGQTPVLKVGVEFEPARILLPGQGLLVVKNDGDVDTSAKIELRVGEQVVTVEGSVHVPPNESTIMPFAWSPTSAGELDAAAFIDGVRVELGKVTVLDSVRPSTWLRSSSTSKSPFGTVLIWFSLAICCITVTWLSGSLENARRRP